MMPPSQQARINLQELKARLSKVLGPDRESQYFSIFSRFLSHRLSKSELDQQVLLTIGKENVALHNQLVKAILFNATRTSSASASEHHPQLPPPIRDTSKPVKGIRRKPLASSANSGGDDQQQLVSPRSNGEVLLPSPRKNRTGVRKAKERQSLLGLVKSEEQESDELGGPKLINAGFNNINNNNSRVDVLRPLQPESAEQPDTDSLGSVSKRPRLLLESSSFPPEELDEQQQQQLLLQQTQDCTLWNSWLVRPPLGTPFCVGSVGASQQRGSRSRFQPQQLLVNSLLVGEEDAGDVLPDAEGMRRRVEQVAVEQGLEGVGVECGNVLNQAVDVYLKRLIAASVELVQSRRRERGVQDQLQQQLHHHHHHQQQQQSSLGGFEAKREAMLAAAAAKIHHGVNGVWHASSSSSSPQMHHQQQQQQQQQMMNQTGMAGASCGADEKCLGVSALDFKVAMEANPHLLGENRPLHMERILLRVFEQQQRQVLH